LGTHFEREGALSVPESETELRGGKVNDDTGLDHISVRRGIEELEIEGIDIHSIENGRGAIWKVEGKPAPI
jgi:biotin operon repressor